MKRALLSTFIILTLLYPQASIAFPLDFFQEKPEIYEKFSREIDIKAEFTKIIIEAGIKIEKENPNLDFKDDKKLTELIQNELNQFSEFYVKKLNIPSEKKNKFKLVFKNLRWSQVNHLFKKAHLGVEFIFKKKGFGIGIAIMCGLLSEYLVPFALINIGLAKFIPLSMMTPWSVIYSFVPNLITKIKIQNMLIETLGDKEKVKAYLSQEKEIYKTLKLTSPSDFIIPLKEIDHDLEYLVVNQHPWWRNVFSKLGFKPDGISLDEITAFLNDNHVTSNFTQSVVDDGNLSNVEKINLLTTYIYQDLDPEITDNFKITFNSSINKIIKQDNNWEAIWKWTLKAKTANSLDEIKLIAKEMPEQMTAYHLTLIWEQILLPEYVKRMDLNFTTSRKLVTDFELYKTKLNLRTSSANKDELIHETFSYIQKITEGHNFKGCKNNPQKIMTFLLSK